jgi:hypothetical protein
MPRLANYKIDNEIRSFKDFENYNGTICGRRQGNSYVMFHWSTKVLEYDLSRNEIVFLYPEHFSQTTSSLVGRIVRSLPRSAVMAFIDRLDSKPKQRRLARMVGI